MTYLREAICNEVVSKLEAENNALKQRVAGLSSERASLMNRLVGLIERLDYYSSTIGALQVDAERYRWLKNNRETAAGMIAGVQFGSSTGVFIREDVEDIIDTAMRKQKESES